MADAVPSALGKLGPGQGEQTWLVKGQSHKVQARAWLSQGEHSSNRTCISMGWPLRDTF